MYWHSYTFLHQSGRNLIRDRDKLTQEIHNMIKEEMELINKMGRDTSES